MKLLAIDFSNLLIRHASNPYRQVEDRSGRTITGPVGALAQITRLVQGEKPTHLLLARDGPRADSFRREIDDAYKAHRPDADEDIRYQFSFAYSSLEELGWPVLAEGGYEADDLLASAAASFEGRTLIVSGDKDLLACAGESVAVDLLRPGGALRCGPEEVREIFGIPPERVRDYKALVGDPSDGISGVPGIGPKRALALLEEFDTLSDLLQALRGSEELSVPGISARQEENLRQNIDAAERSWKLAGLVDNLEISFEELLVPAMPSSDDIDRLRDMDLGALADQLFPQAPPAEPRSLDRMFDDMWPG